MVPAPRYFGDLDSQVETCLAVAPYREALVEDGIPCAQFAVADVRAEHERLQGLGVRLTQAPVDMGTVTTAVLDDTCGNLIQIVKLPA